MEILNKIPICNDYISAKIYVLILLGFIIVAAVGCVFSLAPFGTVREKICMPFMIGGLIGIVITIFLGLVINTTIPGEPTGRYRYEVKISDSTTFKEVTDNYKIVKNRGEIWILEDKDD